MKIGALESSNTAKKRTELRPLTGYEKRCRYPLCFAPSDFSPNLARRFSGDQIIGKRECRSVHTAQGIAR